MKKVAILQSNYIPWKGYFDLISSVDEFIIYDDAQYTKNDWRNRNQIKTPQGLLWLTVPVKVKGRFGQSIRVSEVDGSRWQSAHWKAIVASYKRARFFSELSAIVEPLYSEKYLTVTELNLAFIRKICNYLGIETSISYSWDYQLVGDKTERLVSLCNQAGASEYVSGPSARSYISPSLFADSKIKLSWFNYDDYPEYPQLWGGFLHHVSILDLLFNCGPKSNDFMRYVKK